MTLTPWHVVSHFTLDEASSILAGVDVSFVRNRGDHDPKVFEFIKWRDVIIDAVREKRLVADNKQVMFKVVDSFYGDGPDMGEDQLNKFSDSFEDERSALRCGESYGFAVGEDFYKAFRNGLVVESISIEVERHELSKWLIREGVEPSNIPDQFRGSPSAKGGREISFLEGESVNPKRKNTYLSVIEALVLEVLKDEIPEKPHVAAEALQVIIQGKGIKIDSKTVASVVKELQEARKERGV